MPTEQLILRRVFPVPVTFADLRRAQESDKHFGVGYLDSWSVLKHSKATKRQGKVLARWHAAIKEATGALDEVYAVIDGREVRVAVVAGVGEGAHAETTSVQAPQVNDLLIKADEAGYWQRPHEVRHVIEETMMSTRTRNRIALNSFAVAVATEWTDALIVAAGDDQ
jgi:hypothetical protein